MNSITKMFKEFYKDYDWDFLEQSLYNEKEWNMLKKSKIGKLILHAS